MYNEADEEFKDFDMETNVSDEIISVDPFHTTTPYEIVQINLCTQEEVDTKETTFGGHSSGKCNLCGCSQFSPSSDTRYCQCGHSDYDHEWF